MANEKNGIVIAPCTYSWPNAKTQQKLLNIMLMVQEFDGGGRLEAVDPPY